MIKIVRATALDDHQIRLVFSDGSFGDYDLAELVTRNTEMVRPLAKPAFFTSFFLELGALCWPNGLELSAPSLQRKLAEQGRLRRTDVA